MPSARIAWHGRMKLSSYRIVITLLLRWFISRPCVHLSTFLVEDNSAIRVALVSALEDLVGARFVGYAESEESAVLWLSTHSGTWNLAIVDLFLAQGSGLGVLDACASRQPNQRVAVLTNYATNAMRIDCLARGADVFFDKSTELEQFVTYCETLEDQQRS